MTDENVKCLGEGRVKSWTELDQDGKTERVRGRVKDLERQVERLGKLVRELMEHEHSNRTGVNVPIYHSDGPCYVSLTPEPGKEFF